MALLGRLNDIFDSFIKVIMVTGIAVLVVTLIGQVLSRYLMPIPFPWMEELARYLMIWVAMLGACLGIRRKSHIGVTIITDRLSIYWRAKMNILIYLAMLTLTVVLLCYGWRITNMVSSQTTATLPFTMFWAYLAIPAGALLMSVQIILLLLEDLHHLITVGNHQ